jgi:putative PIG3 family NAD(P)H quinone oxidoreductase
VKCVVITRHGDSLDNLVVTERPDPVAGPDEVAVSVAATALNRADLLQRRGRYPAPPGLAAQSRDVPGLEFAGRVDGTGPGVTRWRRGDRVFGILAGGAYASRVVTHESLLVAIPENLGDTEAAAVPEAYLTAFDALVLQGGMRAGERVLVHAVASGVGTAAVQLVSAWGASAIGTAGSVAKLNRVAALAPFYPIEYKTTDFAEAIAGEFGENAVDLVLDVVGASYWKANLTVLRTGGRLVLVGRLGGSDAETPLGLLMTKRLRIMGTVMRSRSLEDKAAVTREFESQVLPLLRNGRVRPVVDSVFRLEDVRRATERMENNENVGKIVLTL